MIHWFASLIPYAAVLVGMYGLHNAWLAILLYHLGILGFLVYRRPKNIWKRIRLGFGLPVLIPAVVVCAMTATVVYYLWPWISVSESALSDWMARYGLSGAAWISMIPYFCLVHPVLEELHWRELAPDRFIRICRTDLLFAGYHVLVLFQLVQVQWLLLVFGVLVGSSVFWRWSVSRFGGYAIPVVTHAVADSAVMTAVFLLLNG